MLFTVRSFFDFSPPVISSSALSQFHSSLFHSVTVFGPFDGCVEPAGAMMQRRRVMQRGRTYPLTALTFCQHCFILYLKCKRGIESAGTCIRLHWEGSLKAAFSPAERGGGTKLLFPAETMGAAGRHAAARTWMAGLRDVCGSVARGLRPKAPFPAPHNEPAQGRGS